VQQAGAAGLPQRLVVDRRLGWSARLGIAVYFDPVLFLKIFKRVHHRLGDVALRLACTFQWWRIGTYLPERRISREYVFLGVFLAAAHRASAPIQIRT